MPPSNPVTLSPKHSAPLSHFLCYCCRWQLRPPPASCLDRDSHPPALALVSFPSAMLAGVLPCAPGFPMAFTMKPKRQLGLPVPGVPPLLWGCQMARVFLHLVILPSCFSSCYILLPLVSRLLQLGSSYWSKAQALLAPSGNSMLRWTREPPRSTRGRPLCSTQFSIVTTSLH